MPKPRPFLGGYRRSEVDEIVALLRGAIAERDAELARLRANPPEELVAAQAQVDTLRAEAAKLQEYIEHARRWLAEHGRQNGVT